MRTHPLLSIISGAAIVVASAGACHGPERDAAKTAAARSASTRSRTRVLAKQAEAAESVGDFAAARRALAELLRLDPGDLAARDALDRLSAPTEVAGTGLADPNAGALAASPFRPQAGRTGGPSIFEQTPAVATVSTVNNAPTVPPIVSTGSVGQGSASGEVVASVAPKDTAAKTDIARGRRPRQAPRVLARPAVPQTEVATGPESNDSSEFADSAATAAPPAKHKRTWPWTRLQRWIVAKGLVSGAGAGTVIGAIVGNVPGALIAGSVAGGAVGFKKATTVGPAAPYPSAKDSAEFAAKKAREDREKREKSRREPATDTVEAAVALKGP